MGVSMGGLLVPVLADGKITETGKAEVIKLIESNIIKIKADNALV